MVILKHLVKNLTNIGQNELIINMTCITYLYDEVFSISYLTSFAYIKDDYFFLFFKPNQLISAS